MSIALDKIVKGAYHVLKTYTPTNRRRAGMNLDDITLKQARELSGMFGGASCRQKHPLDGKKVVAVLPNGFIHFGILKDTGYRYELSEASNLRYWKQRDNGLPQFAKDGPISDDRIDKIGTVHIETVLFFYECGWS